MRVLVPPSAHQLNGPFVEVTDGFEVRAHRDKAALIEFFERPAGIEWFENFVLLYCREQHDPETVKIIRPATDEERKMFRVPTWIQDEEVPKCCGKPMFFVGQIDDDRIPAERPKGAKYWWHDAASFYVFTCPQCLECKAIGQQF